MRKWNSHWMWAGVAVCGLLLFFAFFPGSIEMAILPIILIVTAILAAFGVDNDRRAEQLREAKYEEQRLATLIENIPVGIGIYVFEDGVLKSGYLNQGYYDMLGVDKQKRMAERKEFMQFVHPDDLPKVMEEIQKDFMEERDFEGVFRLLDGTGKYRWVSLRVRLAEKQGNRKIYYGAFHDNDSLMQAHQALHESQEMMRTAIEHSDLQAWVYDPETGRGGAIIIDPSRHLRDYGKMDYPNDAVRSGLIHPDDVEKFLSLHQRMQAGEAEAEEAIRIYKDGVGYHWERVRYTRLRDPIGRDARVLGTAQDLDAYKELEERFQATIRQTGIFVGVWDVRTGHYEAFFRNRQYMFENAPDDVIATRTIYSEDVEKYRSFFRRIKAGEPSAEGVVRFVSGEGDTYRWFHLVATAVPDRDGKPFRAMFTRMDVTEQVRREMRYLEEMMHRQSLENDVFLTTSINITKNVVQECAEDGEQLGSAIGKTFEWMVKREISFMPEAKDRQAFREFSELHQLSRAIREGGLSKSIEYLRRFPSGDLRWARCRVELMENPETGDWMLFAYVRDIHESKVDEMAFTNVVEGVIDYVTCLDLTTGKARFIRVPGDNTAIPSLGLDSYFDFEEATQKSTAILPVPEEREGLVECFKIENLVRELDRTGSVHFGHWVQLKDRKVRKEMRASYLGPTKSMIVIIERDITEMYLEAEQKREELRKALDAAEAASRAKSDFLSRMSHEIRTPMNAIIGLTALAKGRVNDTEYIEESLSKMDSAAHFLLGLINDVLDISRIERGKMQLDNTPHDMAEFLDGVDVIVRARATEGGVRYTRTTKDGIPAACVFDALKLKQVLVNILSNAVKFTPRDGSVEFVAETLGIAGDWATLRFTIRDTGIGIDREFLPHIFKAFEQESAGNTTRYGGTGLGLAISKSIIDLMGGTISVESEKGVGTVFFVSVTLPVVSLGGETDSADGEEVDFTGMRALLAEDNEINREIATAILEDKGFSVDSATDGAEAVEKFRESEAGTYDVILMDIRMPMMDGFAATEAIRAAEEHADAKTIPIVAMTANAFEEDVQRARAVGMDEYLTKPVEPDTVYKVLWKILRKKSNG